MADLAPVRRCGAYGQRQRRGVKRCTQAEREIPAAPSVPRATNLTTISLAPRLDHSQYRRHRVPDGEEVAAESRAAATAEPQSTSHATPKIANSQKPDPPRGKSHGLRPAYALAVRSRYNAPRAPQVGPISALARPCALSPSSLFFSLSSVHPHPRTLRRASQSAAPDNRKHLYMTPRAAGCTLAAPDRPAGAQRRQLNTMRLDCETQRTHLPLKWGATRASGRGAEPL